MRNTYIYPPHPSMRIIGGWLGGWLGGWVAGWLAGWEGLGAIWSESSYQWLACMEHSTSYCDLHDLGSLLLNPCPVLRRVLTPAPCPGR